MLDFIKNVCKMVGNWFGFSRPVFFGGITILAVGLILLVCFILIIVSVSKKRKANKKKLEKKVEQKHVQTTEEKKEVATEVATVEQKVEIKESKPLEEKKEVVEEKAETKEEVKPAVKKASEKKSVQKASVAKETIANNVKTAKKLNGKWIVEKESEGEFVSKLLASNGEVMLTSEIYVSEEGAKNGIATIIRGVEADNFKIYQDKNNNYYYKIKTANNRLLCVGETYKSKDGCLKAVESVKRIAKDSVIVEGYKEGLGYAEYIPAKLDVSDVKKGMAGKWRIIKTEEGSYSARLYANNGQLMLATEEVSLEKSARNAIESVKKYAEQGNFIIDHDKFGRFYYKLRNAQKSVICIGESYETLDSCTSAVESVRRFALTAVLVED